MTQYFIAVDNTFTVPNSPIMVECGKYQVRDGYPCIQRLPTSEYTVNPIDDDMSLVKNAIVQCAKSGNYSCLVTDLLDLSQPPQVFSFYVYDAPIVLSEQWILTVINELLPTIYKSNNILNNADNGGTAAIYQLLYKQLVEAFYNAISSVGSGDAYNSKWEFTYIGINNFLQNVKYPADFLKAMMQIPNKTGIRMPDIAIFTSRLAYCITGFENPVRVWHDDILDVYNIDIYSNNAALPWALGISQLAINTTLGSAQTNTFTYVLCKIISKLLPVSIKYKFTFLTSQEFIDTFNSTEPLPSEFINPLVKYDAYGIVNTYNLFNTKGYFLNV